MISWSVCFSDVDSAGLSSVAGRKSGAPYVGGVYITGDAAPVVCCGANRCKTYSMYPGMLISTY